MPYENETIFDMPSDEVDDLFRDGDEFDREAAACDHPATEDPDYNSDEDYEDYSEILGTAAKLFNPKANDWGHISFDDTPTVTVDHARMNAWDGGKKEIKYLIKKFKNKNNKKKMNTGDYIDAVAMLLGGPRSDLFHLYQKILPDEDEMNSYGNYVKWIGAFLFSCHMGKNYTTLDAADRVNTEDFATAEEYNRIWNLIEQHNKGNTRRLRSWMMLQDALNRTLQETFIPSHKELKKMLICLDDDKALFNYSSLRELPVDQESHLSRKRNTNRNAKCFTAHVACFTASGLPIKVAFEKAGYGLFDTVVELFKEIFLCGGGDKKPDITNVATLFADRGYLRINLLAWWLAAGGDILGTVMRQTFLPFTFDKKADQTQKSGQMNISANQQKVVYQATYKHGSGGGATKTKDRDMTCTAYVSGTSSTTNLTLSSENAGKREWDHVLCHPKDLRWYYDQNITYYELNAHAFEHVAGEKDPVGELLESMSKEGASMKAKNEAISKENTGHIGHIIGARHVDAVTCNQLDAAWFANRPFCQTSSTFFSQLKLLLPTIGHEDKELREAFEIVAEYANMSKLLSKDNGNEDEDNDSVESVNKVVADMKPFTPSNNTKKLFRTILEELGEDYTIIDNEEQDDDDDGEEEEGDGELETPRAAKEDEDDASVKPRSTRSRRSAKGGPPAAPAKAAKAATEAAPPEAATRKSSRQTKKSTKLKEAESNTSTESDSDSSRLQKKSAAKQPKKTIKLYKNDESHSSDSEESSSRSEQKGGSQSSSSSEEEEEDDDEWVPSAKDAREFLGIFLHDYNGATTNLSTHAGYKEVVENYLDGVDINFVHLCMSELGARRRTSADRDNLKLWVNSSRILRTLIGKGMSDLKEMAKTRLGEDHGVAGGSSNIATFRTNLARALGDDADKNDDEELPIDDETKLMVEMLDKAFMRPLKRNGEDEGTSKYTLAGQRAERSILKELFTAIEIDSKKIRPDVEMSVYQPGLVRKRYDDPGSGSDSDSDEEQDNVGFFNSMRTSADGVLLYRTPVPGNTDDDDDDEYDDVDNEYTVIPVEVKACVSSNTFHSLRRRFKNATATGGLKHGAPEWKNDSPTFWVTNFGEDENGRPVVHPNLHQLVQDSGWLIQCLHHATVYDTDRVILAIGDKRSYLGGVKINFPPALLKAYEKVLRYSYEKTFKWAYAEKSGENKLPKIPETVFKALKNKKLKHLKMTDNALLSFFGLWWSVNNLSVKDTNRMKLPIPKTARIVPLVVAIWNAMKGGSDTISGLLEMSKERIGVRTENNVVFARLLLYHAVVFHRVIQAISARKEVDKFPTLAHWRDAASKRYPFAGSLELFHDILIKSARDENMMKRAAEDMPNPTGVYAPSPAVTAKKRSVSAMAMRGTPLVADMPPARSSIGVTPGKGRSLDNPSQEHLERCKNCLGIFPSKRTHSPEEDESDDESSSSSDDDSIDERAAAAAKKNKKKKRKKKKKKKKKPNDDCNRYRSTCAICRARCEYICNGCGRGLCLTPPTKANLTKVKTQGIKKSYPRYLKVSMPVMEGGRVKIDRETGEPVFTVQYGEYTCYHIAHKEAWKKYLHEKETDALQQLTESTAKVSTEKKKKAKT